MRRKRIVDPFLSSLSVICLRKIYIYDRVYTNTTYPSRHNLFLNVGNPETEVCVVTARDLFAIGYRKPDIVLSDCEFCIRIPIFYCVSIDYRNGLHFLVWHFCISRIVFKIRLISVSKGLRKSYGSHVDHATTRCLHLVCFSKVSKL